MGDYSALYFLANVLYAWMGILLALG